MVDSLFVFFSDKRLIVVMTAEVNTQDDFQFGKEAFDWLDKIVEISN